MFTMYFWFAVYTFGRLFNDTNKFVMLMTHLKRTLELTSCLISSITSLDTSLVRSMPVTLKRKG